MGLKTVLFLASLAFHVHAVVKLPAYRLQHFELLGITRGSKQYAFNGEAVTWSVLSKLESGVGFVALLKWHEIPHIQDAAAKGVFGVVLVLPPGNSGQPPEDIDMELEHQLFQQETISVPVYIIKETPEISEAFARANRKPTGSLDFKRLWSGTITQLTVSTAAPQALRTPKLPTMYGMLSGFGNEEQLPTVTVAAHYDSFGAAPELAVGADSNGSGVAAVLELMRIFSRLYSNSKTHPRANIVFILSAGGKLNYQGTKKLIEDIVESSASDSLLAESLFTMCLDSIGSKAKLTAHVSKPPRPEHAMRKFFNILNDTNNVGLVHKKINLADEIRNWEHERFSLSKLPAFTLSSLATHNVRSRVSLFDQTLDLDALESNVKDIAVALASFIYQKPRELTEDLIEGSLAVNRNHLKAVTEFLTSQSRATQILLDKSNTVAATLKDMMERYLSKGALKTSIFEPDRREPEFVLYDQTSATLYVSDVKPALFDLVLLSVIVAYLGLVYILISNFSYVVRALTPNKSQKKAD